MEQSREEIKELQKIVTRKNSHIIVYNLFNYPIVNYLTLFKDNRIYTPEYQRDLVWNLEKKEMLIDSIMISMPIGNIFLNDRGDLNYEIVDGQQRLDAIWDFYNNMFKWNGLYFEDLPQHFQRRFEFGILATYITKYTDRKSIIELYYRINWAGVEHTINELMQIDKERSGE